MNSYYNHQTVVGAFDLYNGNPCNGKTTSLYKDRLQIIRLQIFFRCRLLICRNERLQTFEMTTKFVTPYPNVYNLSMFKLVQTCLIYQRPHADYPSLPCLNAPYSCAINPWGLFTVPQRNIYASLSCYFWVLRTCLLEVILFQSHLSTAVSWRTKRTYKIQQVWYNSVSVG